jgi:dTDP-4-dehydrorhamnose reductase
LSEHTGLLHVGGPERMSRLEFGHRLAAYLNLDPAPIVPRPRPVGVPEPRPKDTSFDSSRWRGLFPDVPWPGFEDSMRDMPL